MPLGAERGKENNQTLFASIAYAIERKGLPMQLRGQLEKDVVDAVRDGTSAYIASPLSSLTYQDEEGRETFGLEVQGSITGWSDKTVARSVGRRVFTLYDMEYPSARLVLPPTGYAKQPYIEGLIETQWHTIVDSTQPDTLHQAIKHFLQMREASTAHSRIGGRFGRVISKNLK